MKDLGLLEEIMACAIIAVHLLSETVRLLPLQSNKLSKKRFKNWV